MAKEEKTLNNTYVGINQIIKCVPKLPKNDTKVVLEEITTKGDVKGSSIAPLYRLSLVQAKLKLSDEETDTIFTHVNKPSAKAIKAKVALLKAKVEKLHKTKKDIDTEIASLEEQISKEQAKFWD